MEQLFRLVVVLFGALGFANSALAQDSILWFPLDVYQTPYCDFTCYTNHNGVDYAGSGNAVYAPISGTVTAYEDSVTGQVCNGPNYGNYVKIQNGDYEVILAHLEYGSVNTHGGYVIAGEQVGTVGNTGYTMTYSQSAGGYVCGIGGGYHLHLELRVNGVPKDPTGYWITSPPERADPSQEEELEEEEEEDTGSPEPDPEPIGYPFIYLDGIASTDLYDYYSLAQYDTDSVKNEADITPVKTGRPSTTLAVLAADVNGDGDDDIVRVYTTSAAGAVYVYRTSDDYPGTIGQRQTWKTVGREIHEAFLGDTDGDGLPDLILAFDTGTNSKVEWKICLNDGSKFADSCTLWQTDNNDTFGQTGDTFLVADFNGNGQVEILRGRTGSSTCSTSTLWKRLSNGGAIHTLDVQSGSSGTVQDCLGYAGSTFLAADVDNDGSDELVYLKTTSSTVVAYVADYSNSEPNKRLIYNQWASDVGGSSAYYCLNDLSGNGYLDLIRWSSSTLNYSVNNGSSFQEQTNQTKVMNLSQGGNDHLVCGQFEQ